MQTSFPDNSVKQQVPESRLAQQHLQQSAGCSVTADDKAIVKALGAACLEAMADTVLCVGLF